MNEKQLRNILNQELAHFFGSLNIHFNTRFDVIERELKRKADSERVYSQLDGIAARIEDNSVEYAALSHQVDRHERQIRKITQQA